MKYPIPLILILCLLNGCASGTFSVNEGRARFSIPFDWPGSSDKQPVNKEPIIKEPIIKEPVIEEPVIEGAAIEEPVIEEFVSRESPTKIEGIYVDMFKTELYGLFTAPQLEDYRKEGDEEWITFSTQGESEPAGTVTFYLVNGKVKEWKSK